MVLWPQIRGAGWFSQATAGWLSRCTVAQPEQANGGFLPQTGDILALGHIKEISLRAAIILLDSTERDTSLSFVYKYK